MIVRTRLFILLQKKFKFLLFSLVFLYAVVLPSIARDSDAEIAFDACLSTGVSAVRINGVTYICSNETIHIEGTVDGPPGTSGGTPPGNEVPVPDVDDNFPDGSMNPESDNNEDRCNDCQKEFNTCHSNAVEKQNSCISSGFNHVSQLCGGFRGMPQHCDGSLVGSITLHEDFNTLSKRRLFTHCYIGRAYNNQISCFGTGVEQCMDRCLNGHSGGNSGFSFNITFQHPKFPIGGGISYATTHKSISAINGINKDCRTMGAAEKSACQSVLDSCKARFEGEISICPITRTYSGLRQFDHNAKIAVQKWFELYKKESGISALKESKLRGQLIKSTRLYIAQLEVEIERAELIDESVILEQTKPIVIQDPEETPEEISFGSIELDFLKFCRNNLNEREFDLFLKSWPRGQLVFGSQAFN